jgi:hypothetical protein
MRDLLLSSDFLLNLISEAIGIIFTVLIIDRLIAWRERRRTLPAKQVLWAEITNLTDHILEELIPSEFSSDSSIVLRFGKVDGYVHREIKTEGIDKISFKLKQIRKGDEGVLKEKANEYLSLLSMPREDNLNVIKTEIDSVITRSSFLIEPEPVNHLLHIRHALNYGVNTESNKSARNWSVSIYHIAVAVHNLRGWLKKVADEEQAMADVNKEINEVVNRS